MTLDMRDRVQESWGQATAAGTAAVAAAFYEHLLERDPQLGRLFRGAETGEQGLTLMRELAVRVRAAGSEWKHADAAPPPPVSAWEAPHLAVVGHAWLDTLAQLLGDRLTPTVRAAWADLFAAHAPDIRRAALGAAGTSRVVPLRRRRLVEIGS